MRRYTEQEKREYWHARCEECGWDGLTVDCEGFGPIADTGDYDDGYCPRCNSTVCGNDSPYGLTIRLLWLWRAVSFWVWRKKRSERIAEDAFVERCRLEWGELPK